MNYITYGTFLIILCLNQFYYVSAECENSSGSIYPSSCRRYLGRKNCDNGYKYSENCKCLDCDECKYQIRQCDHLCRNNKGSFVCTCKDGYQLQGDKKSCRLKDTDTSIMIFNIGDNIMAKYLNHTPVWKVWKNEAEVTSVSFDPFHKEVYWISDHMQIYYNDLNGKKTPKQLIIEGIEEFKYSYVLFDWFGRNVYVTCKDGHKLFACNLNIRDCLTIIENSTGITTPQADFERRVLFWINALLKIESSGLDGSMRTTVNNIDFVESFSLDYPLEIIYYVIAGTRRIGSCNYKGSDKKEFTMSTYFKTRNIAVWEDRLYWAGENESFLKGIFSVRKRDGYKEEREYIDINETQDHIGDLILYHPIMFSNVKNPCSPFGIKCSHFCLLSPTNGLGYICMCPNGSQLSSDHHTCKDNKHLFILLRIEKDFYISSELTNGAWKFGMLPDYADLNSSDVIYDQMTKKLFIIDAKNELLVKQINTTQWTFERLNVSHVISSSFDAMNRNLYLTKKIYLHQKNDLANQEEFLGSKILVYNVEKAIKANLLTVSNVTITTLKISVMLNKMITCECEGDCVEGKNRIAIRRTDGTEIMILVESQNMSCESLVVDEVERRVYWIDRVSNSIKCILVGGGKIQTLTHNQFHNMRDLAIYKDKLVFIANNYSLVSGSYSNKNFTRVLKLDVDEELIHLDGTYDISKNSSCQSVNCSHICVPKTAMDYLCVCADGYYLKGLDCIRKSNDEEKNHIKGSCRNNPCIRGSCQSQDAEFIICRCPPEFSGDYCEIYTANQNHSTGGHVGSILTSIIITALICYCGFLIYKKTPRSVWIRLSTHPFVSFINRFFGIKSDNESEHDDEMINQSSFVFGVTQREQ